ncbi:PH domain-containing protein [Algibacter pacificus]|uniref:PH domain-containing protein n=1 Tax=Algibacter pacificus TaxID=2599389 RepID=UPI0011CAECC3|nr:PH domain-containing protein [Algibacter pacificus]
MIKYLQLILEPNEKLLWKGRPELKTILLFSCLLIIIFLGVSMLFFLNSNNADCIFKGLKTYNIACLQSLNMLCLGFALLAFLTPFATYVYYDITEYAITSKRILIKTGLIGANVRSIYFSQIKDSFIHVSVLDRLAGSGTILIDTGLVKSTKREGGKIIYSRFLFLNAPLKVYGVMQDCLPASKERVLLEQLYYESNKGNRKGIFQKKGS